MADVGSLGRYKVVVTADYSQLQKQFEAMANFINDSTKQITESLNKSMGAINSTMIAQLQTSVNSLKKAFDGLDGTTKKGGDGFKSYATQMREAEKAAQKCHQEITALQASMANSSVSSADLSKLEQLKAKFRELSEQREVLRKAQEDYNTHLKVSENLETMAAKAKKQADQEGLKQLQERVKQEADAARQTERTQQQTALNQRKRIAQLQTQYRVAYEEINKYILSHAKMSEAVFIRLQGRITALGDEIRKLGSDPAIANPLKGLDYDKYASQFSKWTDFFTSLKHHLTWMASATAIGTVIGVPAATIHTIAEVEKQMAAMKQVNHDVNTSQVILNKTTQDFIGIAQQYGHSVDDIIKAGKLQIAA